jgi:hypothetical protein
VSLFSLDEAGLLLCFLLMLEFATTFIEGPEDHVSATEFPELDGAPRREETPILDPADTRERKVGFRDGKESCWILAYFVGDVRIARARRRRRLCRDAHDVTSWIDVCSGSVPIVTDEPVSGCSAAVSRAPSVAHAASSSSSRSSHGSGGQNSALPSESSGSP